MPDFVSDYGTFSIKDEILKWQEVRNVMQSGNPNNQGDDLYWQPTQYQKQQYPYQQPQQTRQYAPPPIMPPPKRPCYNRTSTCNPPRSLRTQIIITTIILI